MLLTVSALYASTASRWPSGGHLVYSVHGSARKTPVQCASASLLRIYGALVGWQSGAPASADSVPAAADRLCGRAGPGPYRARRNQPSLGSSWVSRRRILRLFDCESICLEDTGSDFTDLFCPLMLA